MSLDTALAFTLHEEGGYVDNPNDHGGATNHGITQHTYDTYRLNRRLPAASVRDIQDQEVRDIYESMYWVPAHCSMMSLALGECHFDWAVNHGVHGALKTLQEVLGIEADGVWGPNTEAALLAQDHDDLWRPYNQLRREWYQADAEHDPSQAEFLTGWLHRVDRLDAYCEAA
jgi:lysozyme family protein